MLSRLLYKRRVVWWALCSTAISPLFGCAKPLDPKLQAEIATIRISENAPTNCRYVGESVSFNRSDEGHPHAIYLFDVEGLAAKRHDEDLRLQAKKLGADWVHVTFAKGSGLGSIVRVSAYYACGRSQ